MINQDAILFLLWAVVFLFALGVATLWAIEWWFNR